MATSSATRILQPRAANRVLSCGTHFAPIQRHQLVSSRSSSWKKTQQQHHSPINLFNPSKRMASTLTRARAIVASAPREDHIPGGNWELDEISVPTELKHGEILVQMVASGICHTDLLMTSGPAEGAGLNYPWVAGHEGSGIVKAVGPGVKKDLAVGDPVLLSFDNCADCHSCGDRHPAYCDQFFPLNLAGVAGVFKDKEGKGPVSGQFFGQSSFASLSVVKEGSVLPAKDLVQNEEELKLFSPLGCGIQTGAGSVLNVVKAGPEDRVMVLGLGGVGLGAIMVSHSFLGRREFDSSRCFD